VTVKGDDIIRNCRECFCKRGYGIRLREHAFKKGVLECPQCAANYVIDNGTLVKAWKNWKTRKKHWKKKLF